MNWLIFIKQCCLTIYFLVCSSTLILVGHSTLKIKMLIHWYNDTGATTVTEMPLKRHRIACTRLQGG